MKHLGTSIFFSSCFTFLLQTCLAVTTVSHPPTIVRQPSHEQFFKVSRTQDEQDTPLILDCEAHGNPEPTYRWTKNGRPFDYEAEGGRISKQPHKGTLHVNVPVDSDEGVYQCFAGNILGTSFSNAVDLRKSDTPNPPKILRVRCDGLTALVEWEPAGNTTAPIESHTIQYNTSFTPGKWEDASIGIPALETKFKLSMRPLANYTFRVIARNQIGPSDPSGHSEVCETPEDVPYKNPDNVVGKGTEKDNLVISWTAMPMSEQNAPGFFYKIYWKREDVPDASWQIAECSEWEKNNLTIPNQPTFKPYRIKVEAHNIKGQAHTAATEVIGYSGEDVPVEEPKNFILLYITMDGRSAKLSWDPVSPESVRGHFRGYKIQTWTVDEGEERLREHVVENNVTKFLFTIFKPASHNTVRVFAFNDMYNGPASYTIEFTTPQAAPDEPNFVWSLLPDVDGKAVVRVTWVPDVGGYPGSHFFVQYRKKGESIWESSSEGSQDSILVQGLASGSLYEIKVVAVNGRYQTSSKVVELETGGMDTPNPPKILRVQCDGLTALVVWEPAGNRSAPTESYTIQYNTSFTPDKWEDASVGIPATETKFKVSMAPWANYTFRVIARNKIGPSEPSGHSEVCETPEDVPYKNPDNVIGKGTKEDNLVISWTAMPMSEQNAPGFFYKIYWKREDVSEASWQIAEISEWEKNNFTILNQPTFKPYRIKVEAHNIKEQAHTAASEVIGYSGEDFPLEEPRNLNLLYIKRDGRSAKLSWDPVSPESVRGHFRGYKIQTWTEDEGERRFREYVVESNVTESFFPIFKPFSRNTVHILAFNDMYTGPASYAIEFTTPQAEPDKPRFVSLWNTLPHANGNVRVTRVPDVEGRPGSHFFVQYKKKGESIWESTPPERNQDSILIQGLEVGSLYKIKVVPVDGSFQTPSIVEEFETGGMVPLEVPKNFKLLYIKDARTAKLSWDPVSAESVRGHFKGYKIQTWTEDEGEERLREQIVENNVTQSSVTIFKPFSRNIVRILAFNDMYDGPASDVLIFYTPEEMNT